MRITRLGKSADLVMIAFQVTSKKPVKLSPEWVWLTSSGKTVPIQDLSLSRLEISELTPATGFVSVKLADLKASAPVTLEFRSAHPLKIQLPEVRSWVK